MRQVRAIDPISGSDAIADVEIAAGKMVAIAPHLELAGDGEVIDGKGCILAPGLVDLYSHSGEPGHEDRETLEDLLAAAAAGGFTRLCVLPDTRPRVDNAAMLAQLQHQGRGSGVHLQVWGALTLGTQGSQMSELGELAGAGAIGFTDGFPIANLALLRRLLEYARVLKKTVALVATELRLRDRGVVREGTHSLLAGLPGDPAMSETAAVAALLEMIAEIGTPVHLMRISTARSVELIAGAKERGVPVTASVSWMHLLFDTTALSTYDPNFRLTPPLGRPGDRLALVEGVKTGVIDAIAIDHLAYTYEEKTLPFAEAPSGAIGLEFALPLLWQEFVATGKWTPIQLWQALSIAPQRCLGQDPLRCALGEAAELVLFDPHKTWTATRQSLKSPAMNTPLWGKQLVGQVVGTWLA